MSFINNTQPHIHVAPIGTLTADNPNRGKTASKKNELLSIPLVQTHIAQSPSIFENKAISNDSFKISLNDATLKFLFNQIVTKTKQFEEEETLGYGGTNPVFRHENIICPKKTAVKCHNDNYLHGNLFKQIDGRNYLATQAPIVFPCQLEVDTRGIFWRACLENCHFVINLTNDDENGRYYPANLNESYLFDSLNLKVTYIGADHMFNQKIEGLTKKIFCLTDLHTSEEKQIAHYHFRTWPDGEGVPPSSLYRFINTLEQECKIEWTAMIHCLAGVGRTGTFITAWVLKHLFDEGKLSKDNYLDVMETVILKGRKARGPYYVMNAGQYASLVAFTEYLFSKT